MKDSKKKYEKIVLATKAFCKQRGFSRAVIGVSGGIDSALTLKVAVDALGKKNVQAIFMPETGLSSHLSQECAESVAEFCNVNLTTKSIDKFLENLSELGSSDSEKAKKNFAVANFKARIRMSILYYFSNLNKALVFGTCNKTELLTGYFTKFGDGAADVEILGDVLKTEVIEIAKAISLPEKIINRPPTAELFADQTDEDELGGTYQEIDKILKKYLKGAAEFSEEDFFEIYFGSKKSTLEKKILERVVKNGHKISKTPIIEI